MQYKTLYGPNFPSLQLEFQEALLDGWRIDENNLPHADIVAYEINLVKDVVQSTAEFVEELTGIVQKAPVKRVGRGASKAV